MTIILNAASLRAGRPRLFRSAAVMGAMVLAASVAGCAETALPSLSTGSLFGSKPDAQAAAAPQKPVLRNDPVARVLQVSRVAARAQRCGFQFDPAKLKGNFFVAEGSQPGADAAAIAKLDQTYTVAYNATLKTISTDEDYCSEARLAHVKNDLMRHLAGDYAPSPGFEKVEEEGLFSFGGGLFGGKKPEE